MHTGIDWTSSWLMAAWLMGAWLVFYLSIKMAKMRAELRGYLIKVGAVVWGIEILLGCLPNALLSANLIPWWASMVAMALGMLLVFAIGVWVLRSPRIAMSVTQRSLAVRLWLAVYGVWILTMLALYLQTDFVSKWVLLAVIVLCWALFIPSGLWAARRIGELRKQ